MQLPKFKKLREKESRQEIELERGKIIKIKNRSSRVVLENSCVRGKVKLPAFCSPRELCVFIDTV